MRQELVYSAYHSPIRILSLRSSGLILFDMSLATFGNLNIAGERCSDVPAVATDAESTSAAPIK
jgi:hypothetical protein